MTLARLSACMFVLASAWWTAPEAAGAEPPGAGPTGPEPAWAPLAEGTTSLDEVANFRVGWRFYEGEEVLRPPAWSGGDEESGTTMVRTRDGTEPILVHHVPWKKRTGSVFMEYRLALGPQTPVVLDVGVAMEATQEGKSDGITFSVHLADGGDFRSLASEHYALARPKGLRVDLSPFAGRKIRLRLQAEPGPKRNTGWDMGRFIHPRITAGRPGDVRMTRMRELVGELAGAALAKGELKRLLNRGGAGIVPSCKLDHVNVLAALPPQAVTQPAGGQAPPAGAVFSYRGADGTVEFRYEPRTGRLDDLECRPGRGPVFQPCFGGGVALDAQAGPADPAQQARLLSFGVDPQAGIARAAWKYTRGGDWADVTWTFRMAGKALVIEAESAQRAVCEFALGSPMAPLRQEIAVPYLYLSQPFYLPAQKAFAMAYIDWTASQASRSPGTTSTYHPRTDGVRNPLRETGYVAVSAEVNEVLPNIPHPPSPHRALLGDKMVLDIWGGSFEQNARFLEEVAQAGVERAAVILHDWQRFGYDVKLPDHLPANPALGGDEKLKALADTARRLGYLFSVHENYIDFYPDAPSWTPADVVIERHGQMQKAWYHPGTKVQSFAMKSHRAVHYAAQNAPEIHRRFGTDLAYLDVNPCVPPWNYVDFEAGQEGAATHAVRQRGELALFKYLQDTHRGPLLGEGHNHFFWAGRVDGVEAQVQGGHRTSLLLDFDLLKLHPQMVNHGMGYYERWLEGPRRGRPWPGPAMLDKYRAQQLAFGHAAFIGSALRGHLTTIAREYHLCQPIQARYATAAPTEIAYEIDGQSVTGSAAAVAGRFDRIRVRYDSGLSLQVNFAEGDWTVEGQTLPPYGFLARGAGVTAWTARRGEGLIADFARTDAGLFCDARSDVYRPWARDFKNIQPGLKSFRDLGGGRIELTYQWLVQDTLEEDLYAFVHFCPVGQSERIAFQGDHRPARRTSTWRPDETLTEGPHHVQVPHGDGSDLLDILIGLHGQRGRASLDGVESEGRRYAIGRLKITRRDGRVEKVETVDFDDLRRADRERRTHYLERMNPEGKEIDFGPAVTDGAFKLLLKDRMELIPLPRGREFGVALDLTDLAGLRDVADLKVVAVDEAGKEIGPARMVPPPGGRKGWLAFRTSVPAARYVFRR